MCGRKAWALELGLGRWERTLEHRNHGIITEEMDGA